ncbi:hypothetical protein NQZ79_g1098 [Umbelopsis isabellina]|nr:hypothetical protein NQZ79_g1098 [Umbelopsis isabellina]
MKFSVSALLAVACASAASATTITVVTPWASTVWNSGGVGDITWNTTSTGGAALTTCSIDMLGGSSTNAEIVAHVTATPIDCSVGKFEITPLGDFASGQYWLRIGAEPNWFYSGKFQFTGKGTVGAVSAASADIMVVMLSGNASSAAVMPTAALSMASGASASLIATASGSGKSAMASASNSLNASASASGKTSGSSNVQASLLAASVAAVGAAVAALM